MEALYMECMPTDDIIDMYYERKDQLRLIKEKMSALRQDLKVALERKDRKRSSSLRLHADTVAKNKARIEDSFHLLEEELGLRFERHK